MDASGTTPPAAAATTTTTSRLLDDAVAAVESSELVGLDIETLGLNPRRDNVRCVQISDGAETFVFDLWRGVDVTPLFEALAKTAVVAHNAKFEWQFVFRRFGVELPEVRDTFLMAKVLACGDPTARAALEALCEDVLGTRLDKGMQGSENWAVKRLTERHLRYAALDAQVLLPLYERLTEDLDRENLLGVARLENAAVPAVARMELEGLPVDRAAWVSHAETVAAEREALEREMLGLEGMPTPEPIPQTWRLSGDDCRQMLEGAGVTDLEGLTAKDLEPHQGHEIVSRLLAYRKAPKGEERENLKAAVLELAPVKRPKPAPPWNFGSPQQVQEICYGLLGYNLDSTDEGRLLRYVDHHPFFRRLLRHRKLSKRASTYGPDWFKEAYDGNGLGYGRVYPAYRQIGTSTGRMASGEKGKSPNAQNVPNDGPYRGFFRAPEGRVLVDADYGQIEVRVYAKMVGEDALLDLFDAGVDVYRATAAKLLGIEEAEVSKEQRQKAKAIMLGLLYGLSATGLPAYAFKNYGVEIGPDEAEELVAGFFELYPNIAADHDGVLAELRKNGTVDRETISGRRRDGITNRNEAINAPIQGSAADGLKIAMARVYERLRAFGGTAFIVTAQHDELLIECDEADAERVLEATKETMVRAMDGFVNAEGRKVPIVVEGTVAKHWTKG